MKERFLFLKRNIYFYFESEFKNVCIQEILKFTYRKRIWPSLLALQAIDLPTQYE